QFDWLGVLPGQPNAGIVVSGAYEHLALLSTVQPVTYRFVLVTGQSVDQSDQIQSSLTKSFGRRMTTSGIDPADPPFSVTRLDTAQAVRQAASGVDLVYSIIAWGILLLGGLGLLVAEMIIVRERAGFFGLSRAIGSTGRQVVAIVVTDVLLVLV